MDDPVFKRYPATQVQQPMCLHKISWRDLGADLPTVPPIFNSLFTRTTLYIPAPGMLSWKGDRQPWRCLYLAQWGYESRRDDQMHWWMPTWSSDPEVVSPACLARRTLVVRWSNACKTGQRHVDGRKSSLSGPASAGQMPA